MHRPDADRNLLFGILALQMDFITRDALIAAMGEWVLNEEAAQKLEALKRDRKSEVGHDDILLAIACRKLGSEAEAKAAMLRAVAWIDGPVGAKLGWEEKDELRLLRAEADAAAASAKN